MTPWPMRRIGACAAVTFVVLTIIAFAIPGSMPDYDASPSKITASLMDNHKAILIATVLIGLALFSLVAVIGQLVDLLRSVGYPDAGAAVGVAGAAMMAVLAVGIGMFGALSQMAMSGTPPETLRAFYMADQFVVSVPLAWLGLGLVVPVTRVALAGALPRWVVGPNALIAILLALGGISVRGSGVFQVGTGLFAWLGVLALLVFFLEVAALLWRSAPATATAPHAAVTAA